VNKGRARVNTGRCSPVAVRRSRAVLSACFSLTCSMYSRKSSTLLPTLLLAGDVKLKSTSTPAFSLGVSIWRRESRIATITSDGVKVVEGLARRVALPA